MKKNYADGGDIDFPPDQDMRDVSPEDVAEAKRRARARKAFNAAMTSEAAIPAPMGVPRRPRPAATMPNVDVMGNPTGMKKGGSVSSASKRADGIAQRGKTRGVTVAMCYGGMAKGKK